MNQLETEVKEMIHFWETKQLTNYTIETYLTKWKKRLLEKENGNG